MTSGSFSFRRVTGIATLIVCSKTSVHKNSTYTHGEGKWLSPRFSLWFSTSLTRQSGLNVESGRNKQIFCFPTFVRLDVDCQLQIKQQHVSRYSLGTWSIRVKQTHARNEIRPKLSYSLTVERFSIKCEK